MQQLPRYRTTIGNTELEGPVDNERCPACGNTDSIYKETDREPYTPVEIALRSAFLLINLFSLLVPRATVRMRCAQCDCRFPGRLSGAIKFLIALGVCAVLAIAGAIAWYFRAYITYWAQTQWQANPAFLVTIASILGTALILIAFVAIYPSPKRATSEPESGA